MIIKNLLTTLSYLLLKNLFSNHFNKKQLRVMTIHNIEDNKFDEFEKLILFLKKSNWKFINPEEFINFRHNPTDVKNNSILITFDDGYLSQFHFAKKVLCKYNIKGIFFVVNDFLKISENQKKSFIKNNLFPNKKINNFSNFSNMSHDHLKELIDDGHLIGAHTKSHLRLSEINNIKTLQQEIVESADELEKKLNIKINHFAYTFGNYESISPKAIQVIVKRFKYIYSGIRGNNVNNDKIISREAINFYSDHKLNLAILNGIYDVFYKNKLNSINDWL